MNNGHWIRSSETKTLKQKTEKKCLELRNKCFLGYNLYLQTV